MTIASADRGENSYTATGSSATYPYDFMVFSEDHLQIFVVDTLGNATELTLSPDDVTEDYTVGGVGNGTGGDVTLLDNGQAWLTAGKLTAGWGLYIFRTVPLTQLANLRGEGGYNPDTNEQQMDLQVMGLQQIQQQLNQALQVPITEAAPATLPSAVQRANGFLAFDAAGAPMISTGPSTVPAGTTISIVDSVAALKALAAPSSAVTYLARGYYAAGDGGGGIFRWNSADSSTDDGGFVVQLNAGGVGRWNRLYDGGWVNVRWFGAKCDSATDDTTKIQAAIDYFGGTSTKTHGGVVKIPGCSIISGTLSIKNKSVTLAGEGWGVSNQAPYQSSLKWNGAAGSPMVKLWDGFGAGVDNLRFIGKSTAKPSCAIEISQSGGGQTNDLTTLRRVWVGQMYGLDSDPANQFTSGILVTGATNGNSNLFEHIMITSCDSYGMDFQNGNASDTHLNVVWIQLCATAIRTSASLVATSLLITNSSVSDLELATGGKMNVTDFVSEVGARMCKMTGDTTKLVIRGGSWQATAGIAADGIFIDTGTSSNWIIDLQDFQLDVGGYTPGPTPTIRAYHTGGSATNGFLRLVGTWSIYPANLTLGTSLGANDAHTVIYQPAQVSGQDPMPTQQLTFDFTKAANRVFQSWRNDFAGKFNVFGGDFRVDQLPTPTGLGVVAAGGTGTTYGYRVSALTYAGETLACTEVTVSGGAVLGGAVKNTLTWNPVQGAKAYKVYGRTSGAELLMTTIDWSTDLHPGYTHSPFPTYVDDGTVAVPAGALPVINTTGNGFVEGTFTMNNSGGTVTSYLHPCWFGSYALWVDSGGKLRIKSSAPTSDTDGTVVGTQV